MTTSANEKVQLNEVKKQIKILAGTINDVQLTSVQPVIYERSHQIEDKKNNPEKKDKNTNKKTKCKCRCETCSNGSICSSPLFFLLAFSMFIITLLLFLYLLNLIIQVTNPKGVEVVQSDSMFFDYLVTDIFTIHKHTISSHSRELTIDFNCSYGVNFSDMLIVPNGTITATNCNFTEMNFQKIKIKGSTILSITPQNDEVIFDLPTININKSMRAMELECSGFTIKNGKLFDSTGIELTWPSPGDSRYSFLSSSRSISENNNDLYRHIFNIHPKNSIFDLQNLPNDFKSNFISSKLPKNTNHSILDSQNQKLYQKNKVKDTNSRPEFIFKCRNITASYDSFACISTIQSDGLSVILIQCEDSKCTKTITTTINITNCLNNGNPKKMLLFNQIFIAILFEGKKLYIFDEKGTKIDEISDVNDINVIDDGISRYLLYLSNNNIYQYQNKMIFSMQNISTRLEKFSSDVFKSNLIVFTNCSEFNQKDLNINANVKVFCGEENIDSLVIDKNGIILAIDSINHQILICDTEDQKCDNLISFETEKSIQAFPLRRGGFMAISIDKYSKLSYHFFNKQKINKSSKVFTTKTSETADEIFIATSRGKYPKIYSIKNGIAIITHCSNSKCLPGFAN